MLLSHFFMHHKTPAPRFAPGLFLALVAVFAILSRPKPVIGLAGLGTVLIVTGVLVELNRQRIWDNYVKSYKKKKGLKGLWTKPSPKYYLINTVFLWPFVIFIGVVCLWVAYSL